MSERNYEFRQRLNVVHQPDRRAVEQQPAPGELAVNSGWRIVLSAAASAFLRRLAADLKDYLATSMGEALRIDEQDNPANAMRRLLPSGTRRTCESRGRRPRAFPLPLTHISASTGIFGVLLCRPRDPAEAPSCHKDWTS